LHSFKEATKQIPIREFSQRSDLQAWRLVIVNYALIAFAFALPVILESYWWSLLTVVLLANRQLGLGILMHDCAHNALFKAKSMNEFIGHWLCAAPVLAQLKGYQQYHLQHHAKAGTEHDPDYPNYRPYPVSQLSVYRKFTRDLLGITGLKNLFILLLMHAGIADYDMAYKSTKRYQGLKVVSILNNLIKNLYRSIVFHMLLFGVLYWAGSPMLYGLWWIAYLTVFALFSRIRNAAEHANVPNLLDKDPRLHARTVYAGVIARLTVAPNHVNFHIEHHWLPQVPPYRLAALHHFLIKNKALDGAEVLPGYWAVIRKLA
jgi:fatty acid desaturase